MAEDRACVIITAGGSGKRFGESGLPKQYAELCGKPVIYYALRSFHDSDSVDEVLIVVPRDLIDYTREELVQKYGFNKVTQIVAGGDERQHSVENGFRALSDKPGVVLVHDGVRPFIKKETIETVIKEALRSGAAITAIKVTDTVKKASPDSSIEGTLDREGIWLAQTPQGFRYEILDTALKKAGADGYLGTDESILVEMTGARVKLVEGSRYNIKITTKEDILLGELMIKEGLV